MSVRDHAELVAATAEAAKRLAWADGHNAPSPPDVRYVVDAVLPLIADVIEDPIRLGESVHFEFCSLAQAGALVRSFIGARRG